MTSLIQEEQAPNQPLPPIIKEKTTGPSPELITYSPHQLYSLPLPSPQRTWEVTPTTELFSSQMHGKITNPQYGVSMHHSSNPKNTWQPSNKSSSYTLHSIRRTMGRHQRHNQNI